MMFRKSLAALTAALIFVAQAVTPAAAMFGVTNLAGFGATSGATAYSVVHLGSLTWSSGSTITGSIDIGAADSNKEIFLVTANIGNGSVRTLTAASTTVDGNAVTKFTTESNPTGNVSHAGGFVATPTSAGSVTITATFSGTLSSGIVGVFAVYSRPKTSGSNQTDAASATASGTSVSVSATTINVNGIWFASHVHNNTNATTWNNGTNDNDVTNGSARYAVAHRDVQGSSSTPTDTFSWTGSVGSGVTSWAFD